MLLRESFMIERKLEDGTVLDPREGKPWLIEQESSCPSSRGRDLGNTYSKGMWHRGVDSMNCLLYTSDAADE